MLKHFLYITPIYFEAYEEGPIILPFKSEEGEAQVEALAQGDGSLELDNVGVS